MPPRANGVLVRRVIYAVLLITLVVTAVMLLKPLYPQISSEFAHYKSSFETIAKAVKKLKGFIRRPSMDSSAQRGTATGMNQNNVPDNSDREERQGGASGNDSDTSLPQPGNTVPRRQTTTGSQETLVASPKNHTEELLAEMAERLATFTAQNSQFAGLLNKNEVIEAMFVKHETTISLQQIQIDRFQRQIELKLILAAQSLAIERQQAQAASFQEWKEYGGTCLLNNKQQWSVFMPGARVCGPRLLDTNNILLGYAMNCGD